MPVVSQVCVAWEQRKPDNDPFHSEERQEPVRQLKYNCIKLPFIQKRPSRRARTRSRIETSPSSPWHKLQSLSSAPFPRLSSSRAHNPHSRTPATDSSSQHAELRSRDPKQRAPDQRSEAPARKCTFTMAWAKQQTRLMMRNNAKEGRNEESSPKTRVHAVWMNGAAGGDSRGADSAVEWLNLREIFFYFLCWKVRGGLWKVWRVDGTFAAW